MMVESYRSSPESLDPAAAFSDVAHEILGRVYSGFLRYDGAGRLAPDLAIHHEATPERVSLRFSSDVAWHDGRPLSPGDVVETISRYGSDEYPFSTPFKTIGRVDVSTWPDVTFYLDRPSFAILHALTSRVLPAHVKDLDHNPIGTGFYRVGNRDAESISLVANPSYYRHPAAIPAVRCRTVPDPTTQYLELAAGSTDLAEVSIDLLRKAERDPDMISRVRVLSVPTRAVELLFFNLNRLTGLSFRRAITQCVNREEIVRYLYWGHARVVDTPFLDAEWKDDQAAVPGFNPGSASNGLDRPSTPARLTILYNSESSKRGQIAQVIQQSLIDHLGIEAVVIPFERGLFEKRLFSGDFDCAIYGFSFAADPDDVGNLYRSDSEYNVSAYRNRDVDELFAKAADLLPGEEKRSCYHLIQRTICDDLPSLPLLTYSIPMGVSRRLNIAAPAIIGDTYRFTREQNLWTFA